MKLLQEESMRGWKLKSMDVWEDESMQALNLKYESMKVWKYESWKYEIM